MQKVLQLYLRNISCSLFHCHKGMVSFFPVSCSLFAFPRAVFIFDLIATHVQGSWAPLALAIANFAPRIAE